MRKLWILVANSSFAQIYEVNGLAKNIKEIHHLDFPDGRKKPKDVYSDSPTRKFQSMGFSRHAVVNEVDYHTHVQNVFAHQINELLKKGQDEHSFEELALIAPTEFMGMLHTVLSESIQKTVYKEVRKDLPLSNDHSRLDTIIKYLDLP